MKASAYRSRTASTNVPTGGRDPLETGDLAVAAVEKAGEHHASRREYRYAKPEGECGGDGHDQAQKGHLVRCHTREEAEQHRSQQPGRDRPVDVAGDNAVAGLAQASAQQPPCRRQRLGGVDVDPAEVPHVDDASVSCLREHPDSAGQRTIALADALLDGRKDARRAVEHSGVERVVLAQPLPDGDDLTVAHGSFVASAGSPTTFPSSRKSAASTIPAGGRGWARRRCTIVSSKTSSAITTRKSSVSAGQRREHGRPVSEGPVVVADRHDAEPATRRELRDARLDQRRVATRDDEEIRDAGRCRAGDRSLDQGEPEDGDQRLRPAEPCQPSPATGRWDQALHAG